MQTSEHESESLRHRGFEWQNWPVTALEIADLIERLKGHFVLTAVGLSMAVSPDVDRLLAEVGVSLDDPIAVRRHGGPDYVLPIRPTIEESQTDNDRKLDVIDAWLDLAIFRVADELEQHNYFDKAPILAFLRHVRNGLAHGNRFDLRPGNWMQVEAKYGKLQITEKLNGERVLGSGGFLKRGDALALLDDIAAHLRTEPSTKTWKELGIQHTRSSAPRLLGTEG
ncbi:hypothetical protein Pd630_LPD16051 (plasmid) [Rhodococcus opacus PD630]|uniref:hypothetical protein n=1 Tax=Rhodococcus opacus TaxID=37919 RepID=UPI00042F40B7|nr:hypothetical protein [Rhodococcus opacus]AHK36010.1 hypothetical protein Pd630_LPD16051 [Rhodococcus opacus PD630]